MSYVNDYTELGYGDLYHMGKNIQGYNNYLAGLDEIFVRGKNFQLYSNNMIIINLSP